MEAFIAKYSELVRQRSEVNGLCRIWTGRQVNHYGVVRYKNPHTGVWRTVSAHRFIIILDNKNFDLPADLDASHLCHNSLCVEREHLVLEPHSINNNRIHCKNSQICTGHGEYPDCMLT